MARILLIDDDTDLTDFLRPELEASGHVVECLDRAEHGPELLGRTPFDLVLLDNRMPGMTGIEFLEALRAGGVEVPVILMTGAGEADTVIRAFNLGAFDYVDKPADFQSLLGQLDRPIRAALDLAPPARGVQVAAAARPADGPALVIGRSRAMVDVCRQIGLFARSANPVLIRGETGTGKELVARAIHANSPRKGKPFVALNCTALTESLLESELFGHESGAFNEAKLRKGKFEYASGGTLFLDEIGDMPMNMQVRLLRVLEYQEVTRVGGNEPVRVDVRVLSATHRNLDAAIREGTFREDLLYRLNRVTLRLPPLRDRLDDLPALIDYFLARAAEAAGRRRPVVTPATLDRLRAHRWPGNVRELQNVVFRAVGVCRGPQLLPGDLEFAADGEPAGPAVGSEADALAGLHRAIEWAWNSGRADLWPLLHDLLERELLRSALVRADGNQSKVGELLNMNRQTVAKRMEKYGLK